MAAKNTSKAKMLLCFQTLLDMVKKRAALGLAPPTNEEEWFNTLKKDGLIIIDVYNKWSGPCLAMSSVIKKIRVQCQVKLGREFNHTTACCDDIPQLNIFKRSCKPVFLFYRDQQLIWVIQGADAASMRKYINEEMKDCEPGTNRRTRTLSLEDAVPVDQEDLDSEFEIIEETERRARVVEETGVDFYLDNTRVLLLTDAHKKLNLINRHLGSAGEKN
ncbi:thioredoxin domain-containing protein 3 homolog [Eurytemora carolleeae]|uniref:thioredoxin domain-containing protein 3 homolog n=1 Tax=Eurytemora carolleeae TaxID=1294199 RepID=UPI000C768712|nr:thioredoxin domain-containing protein 3 homolog [Eurytemora carolleeae]|eukprot:XP_023331144.1 thioredoxin domain-containing protein 3 homolog [Eurytemora affinis]